ncbi:MAG: hypothetical protein ACPHID_05760 [Thermoplasmatota archaeon]
MNDDEGFIHVFEALIVGVLIITAILFMTSLSGPSQSESTGGLDLGRISADTLQILEARAADSPGYTNRLDELVSEALQGDSAEAEAFLGDVLPSGTRFLLRLDNGVEPLTLLPTGGGIANAPRNAQGAEVFYFPDWTVHVTDPDPASEAARPGEALTTFTAGSGLTAPDGSTTAPGGGTWSAWWLAHDASGRTVPPDVPYGLWERGGSFLRVQGDQPTDHAVYAVQLLVWPGA